MIVSVVDSSKHVMHVWEIAGISANKTSSCDFRCFGQSLQADCVAQTESGDAQVVPFVALDSRRSLGGGGSDSGSWNVGVLLCVESNMMRPVNFA